MLIILLAMRGSSKMLSLIRTNIQIFNYLVYLLKYFVICPILTFEVPIKSDITILINYIINLCKNTYFNNNSKK